MKAWHYHSSNVYIACQSSIAKSSNNLEIVKNSSGNISFLTSSTMYAKVYEMKSLLVLV